jgi:hypothetical protein
MDPSPWLCVGDSNEILENLEKHGFHGRPLGKL